MNKIESVEISGRIAYTPENAAKYCGGAVNMQTLANWRANDKGPPYVKIGQKVFYFQEDLVKFIESKRVAFRND